MRNGERGLDGIVVPTKFTMAKGSMNHTVASPLGHEVGDRCQNSETIQELHRLTYILISPYMLYPLKLVETLSNPKFL